MDQEIPSAESFNPKEVQNKATREAVVIGCVSVVFVLLTLMCCLGFFYLTSLFGSGGNGRNIDWNGLGSAASLLTSAFVVGGLTFAFIDYVRNAVQRKREDAEACFNIYREVYDRLMSPKDLEARRWIILNLPTLEKAGNNRDKWLETVSTQINHVPDGWQRDRPPGRDYLKHVLNTFDFIGFVARHYWNMDNELVMWMSPPVAKVWERIEVYVEYEAKQRNEEDYYASAREIGKRCVEWRRKHFPDSKPEIIDNGT